jgi:uncharacterized protein YukJ
MEIQMLRNYAVLRGRPLAARIETADDSPHYQIHVRAANQEFRVAVNVQSIDHSSLLYSADEQFGNTTLTNALSRVAKGLTSIKHQPGGLALDYQRGGLVDKAHMQSVPANRPGPDNDLNDRLNHFVQRAIQDASIELYAIGEAWGPERAADKVFHFKPGRGIHNIHMNQGNDPGHTHEDGVWQDGALFIHVPKEQRWVAIFLAFVSQSWHTDDHGHSRALATSATADDE